MAVKSMFLALSLLTLAAPAPVAPPASLLDPFFAEGQGDTRAVLLLQDGRVVAKRYAAGYSDNNRFISWSMAKTITGLLAGELVADGRLQLDAPAPVAEWQGANDPRRAITLRHLMTMHAGLRHIEVGEPVENSDTNQAEFVTGTAAMAAYGIAQPLEARPGATFEYSTLTSIILSEIITRTLTPSRDPRVRANAYRAFAEQRLFRPLGIRSAMLDFDGAGTQVGGSLIYMSLDDWGRFGMLLIDGRSSSGEQVIDPAWLRFVRTPSATSARYGGQLWLNRRDAEGEMFPGAPADVFSAEGHLGQHVTVSPSQRAVLVRLGNTPDSEGKAVNAVIARTLLAVR